MKLQVKLIILNVVILFSTYSCSEDYLDRSPLSNITAESYFQDAQQFKLYVNQFYMGLTDIKFYGINYFGVDAGSDNMIGSRVDPHLNGETVVPSNDDNWDMAFDRIRKINIMLTDGIENVPDNELESSMTYIGEGYFFRALEYFKLLKRYGGVPIIKKPLFPTDDELQTKRASRYEVASFILDDLNKAIKYIDGFEEGTRLSKEAAAALKARFCLFEGTWEKYHALHDTPFKAEKEDGKIADGTEFLEEALKAADIVISSELFSLYNETDEPYFNLFNRADQSKNPEIIFYRHIMLDQGQRQDLSNRIYLASSEVWGNVGMTKDLIEAYIDVQGNPLSLSSYEYNDDSITSVYKNRDPRLRQMLYTPGYKVYEAEPPLIYPYLPNLDNVPTGYPMRKGASQIEYEPGKDITDYIIFRYGEVLLNYIEAKAELDIQAVTQNDLDITINALRDRADLSSEAYLSLGNIPEDNENIFHGDINSLLVEIRRERRVELACEGYRKEDLRRWNAIEDALINNEFYYGAKYSWWIEKSDPAQGRTFYEGQYPVNENGYLNPWRSKGYDGFNSNRDYLYPIPTNEMGLAGYQQNPGWGK